MTTAPLSPADMHDDQIVALLRSGAHAALLSAYFGEPEYRELSHLAKLAAKRRNPRGARVFILPGIMGSRLGTIQRGAPHLLWLHPRAVSAGALTELALPGSRKIKPIGVMLPGYLKLKLSLEIAGFRPLFYPFDWRLGVDKLARGFMRVVESCGARVYVVAHSMGGLVARMALKYDKKRRLKRIIQLGSPNDGSFAPVQALRAAYPTVRKIAALDHTSSAEQLAEKVFRTLPGLYQMLPTPDESSPIDLFDSEDWPNDGPKPDDAMLATARRLRERLPPADERCFAIIGVLQETIVGVTHGDGGFEYEIRFAGDGTVPSERARWPGAPAWYVAENHGGLTLNDEVLGAVADLLANGETARLSTTPPPTPDGVRRVTDRELRARATAKVRWEALSLDSRRRILEPLITPEFDATLR